MIGTSTDYADQLEIAQPVYRDGRRRLNLDQPSAFRELEGHLIGLMLVSRGPVAVYDLAAKTGARPDTVVDCMRRITRWAAVYQVGHGTSASYGLDRELAVTFWRRSVVAYDPAEAEVAA